MSWIDITAVFLFMIALVGGSSYAAAIYANWQSDETRKEIEQRFAEFRQQIKETT